MRLEDGFDHPNTTITAIDLAFPARGADPAFLPPAETIPEEFDSKSSWDEFHSRWFFEGLPSGVELFPREGIDAQQAWDHLRVVQGCYGSMHEHKMAALSWLSYRWFEGHSLWLPSPPGLNGRTRGTLPGPL